MASFRKNFTILMTLQVSTYVAPLLTLPWLARVLGPNEYGRLSFALAFTAYFITLTNFSFSLTATPRVSINRDDRAMRSRVFWETMAAQSVLAVAGFLFLLALTFAVPHLAENRALLLTGFGMAVGAMLIPTWYFQGIEDLGPISILVFAGRALSVPAMYLFVRHRDDVYHAMLVNALVPLLSGIAICAYLYFKRELDFVPVSLKTALHRLKEGWSVFMATSLVEIYASSNIVLLTFISGNVAAGYFAAGDKLIRAALGMLQPLKTAAYPRVSFLMHHAREDAFAFLRKMFVLQGSIVAFISVCIFFGAPLAVKLLYGPQFEPTIDVLHWMAFVPLMSGLSDLFGVQTMLPLGLKTAFSRVLIASAVLNFGLLAVLAKLFGEQGAAATVLVVEASIAAAMAFTLHLEGVPLLKRSITTESAGS
ncbi:Membrane protein involved in the export of O-antigen, teichoic acid lipoteichoic acid [Candidatus Burkholderia verschuerenii]|uniref:Membrane protein involved in the export of O-antigen, teichoic acid lipoteichoic acid n=1 Tax=Candidatus Burkholderia verschuerenii TaxID=242163 RepID=A0A0L0MAU1_9BURK|nr:flippase [Candidatus Burkholderia verschuerenii]KND59842.1 Membrane protein involved in the export of O-antigen, teichoic acid lipoteichoic acid [Candidatus Burkholderia verschuerenii]